MSPRMRGWVVAFAGLGINLTLGVLYTWQVIASALTLPAEAGGFHLWTTRQAMWPYVTAIGFFAFTMVFAGRMQDRVGPRWVATAGGAMVGFGMIVASLSPVRLASATAFPYQMVLGFGVLTGVGIGLAYASATPAAVKWFSQGKTGLVAGTVVCGFGLAPLWATPLAAWLIRVYGVGESFLFLGVVFFVLIVGLAQLIVDPPFGYVPPGSYSERPTSAGPRPAVRDFPWSQMLRAPSFYILWGMFACSAFAGVMVIGDLSRFAAAQLGAPGGAPSGWVLAATLALGNGAGRPLAGFVSDRIGRQHVMLVAFTLQAILMAGLPFVGSMTLFVVIGGLIGLSYGAGLALIPATTFDFFGMKNAGANYGLVFTAWGFGGVLGSVAGSLALAPAVAGVTQAGVYAPTFTLAALMCMVSAVLTFVLRPPDSGDRSCPVVDSGAVRQA